MDPRELQDPFVMRAVLWPDVTFYREQRTVIESVWKDDETYVAAGNMLGKDFVAGFIVLWFFLTRQPCRVVTTSAKADHLRVLWGETNQYIFTAKYPLTVEKGGPLRLLHQELRKVHNGFECPKSYVKGLVASPDAIAAMQGHHVADTGDGVPRTMFVSDESSSVSDEYYTMASTWMKRALIFGNTWPCENFFKRGIKGGDVPRPDGGLYRRVIRIRAEDSPNIRLAKAQIAAGVKPTGEMLVPGVKSYAEYCKNLALWDDAQKCVSLGAEFYSGPEIMLFPPNRMVEAARVADSLRGKRREAVALGCDPGEGRANTAWSVVDAYGVVEQLSKRTVDTNVISGETVALGRRHGVDPKNWVFDRGGGGKQIADRLRAQGFPVRTVGFGESVQLDVKRGLHPLPDRKEQREEKYEYFNRRAQMYGELSELVEDGYGVPAEFAELRRQMSLIPKTYDNEGRLKLLPKSHRDGRDKETDSLVALIGNSPDELDSAALAVYGMLHKPKMTLVGAVMR